MVHQFLLLVFWGICRGFITLFPKMSLNSSALIIPADPDSLLGSKGDEAMMIATMTAVKRQNSALGLIVGSTNTKADALAKTMGMSALRIWGGPLMPFKFLRQLLKSKPAVGLVNGADIMDGYYSPVMSLRMIIAADLLSRCGARTAFVGFSMNAHPVPSVKYAFKHLDRRVRVNLRDPLSWERYENLIGGPCNLVADSAFLLEPVAELTGDSAKTADWMRLQRSHGRKVLVLNLHPMLFLDVVDAGNEVRRLIASVVSVMHDLTPKHSLSWLLLPHDNRSVAGDMTTLCELQKHLGQALEEYTLWVKTPPSAAEIKTLLGHADGAITGRMHLAIAALGQAVPVMTFAYQDKFAGLLQHFNMPSWLVLDAEKSTKPDFLSRQVERFILELPELKILAEEMLPKVTAAAESTFEGVL